MVGVSQCLEVGAMKEGHSLPWRLFIKLYVIAWRIDCHVWPGKLTLIVSPTADQFRLTKAMGSVKPTDHGVTTSRGFNFWLHDFWRHVSRKKQANKTVILLSWAAFLPYRNVTKDSRWRHQWRHPNYLDTFMNSLYIPINPTELKRTNKTEANLSNISKISDTDSQNNCLEIVKC